MELLVFGTTCIVLYCFVVWMCLASQAWSSTTSSTYTVILLFCFILYYNILGRSLYFFGDNLYSIVLLCGVNVSRLSALVLHNIFNLYTVTVLLCFVLYYIMLEPLSWFCLASQARSFTTSSWTLQQILASLPSLARTHTLSYFLLNLLKMLLNAISNILSFSDFKSNQISHFNFFKIDFLISLRRWQRT